MSDDPVRNLFDEIVRATRLDRAMDTGWFLTALMAAWAVASLITCLFAASNSDRDTSGVFLLLALALMIFCFIAERPTRKNR